MALLICLFDDLNSGDLGALGDTEAKGVPKKQVEKAVRFCQKKKHEPVVVPPLVPQAAGISRTRFRRYTDHVVVSDTLEGLGVLGGAATGGSSAGSKPADEKNKRKVEEKAAGAGERKRPRSRTTRTAAVTQPKPAVVTGKSTICSQVFVIVRLKLIVVFAFL
ncbi:hypothetical protein HanLR1_Chr02g0055571 [Helianthus annuus]|nr:hypothetical protein HanLR1_Chr02g0055571 [Helianthus annuus]